MSQFGIKIEREDAHEGLTRRHFIYLWETFEPRESSPIYLAWRPCKWVNVGYPSMWAGTW